MSTNRQAMCERFGHDWSNWGLWRAIYPEFAEPMSAEGPSLVDIKVEQVRTRQCQRCGTLQDQDGAGALSIVP